MTPSTVPSCYHLSPSWARCPSSLPLPRSLIRSHMTQLQSPQPPTFLLLSSTAPSFKFECSNFHQEEIVTNTFLNFVSDDVDPSLLRFWELTKIFLKKINSIVGVDLRKKTNQDFKSNLYSSRRNARRKSDDKIAHTRRNAARPTEQYYVNRMASSTLWSLRMTWNDELATGYNYWRKNKWMIGLIRIHEWERERGRQMYFENWIIFCLSFFQLSLSSW